MHKTLLSPYTNRVSATAIFVTDIFKFFVIESHTKLKTKTSHNQLTERLVFRRDDGRSSNQTLNWGGMEQKYKRNKSEASVFILRVLDHGPGAVGDLQSLVEIADVELDRG